MPILSGKLLWVVILDSSPCLAAIFLTVWSISSWTSTAMTFPVSPTIFAIAIVNVPGPQPKSRTVCPLSMHPLRIFSGLCMSLRIGLSKADASHHGQMRDNSAISLFSCNSMSSSVTVQLFQIIEQMSSRDIALVIGPDPADLSCMESPSMFGYQLPTLIKWTMPIGVHCLISTS